MKTIPSIVVLALGLAPSTALAQAAPVVVAADITDHEAMIHRFAVGFMGTSDLPIAKVNAGGGLGNVTVDSLTTPFVGGRYWLTPLIGIDAGIGVAYSAGSSSVKTTAGGTTSTVSTDLPSSTGFGIHGGVPFALAYSKHFTFEVIPEFTFGVTSSTIKGMPGAPGGPAVPDTNLSGVRFDLGGRIGGEVHFGFIGIPQLALQGSVGIGFRYSSVSASLSDNSASVTINSPAFGTSVQASPWAIFTDNITALYYF